MFRKNNSRKGFKVLPANLKNKPVYSERSLQKEGFMQTKLTIRKFIVVALITSLWIHVSEVFRYFVIVMPYLRQSLSGITNVAPMSWGVFAIWGSWDILLTCMVVFIFWLYSKQFGNTLRSVIVSGTLSWLFFFVLFWIGMVNMGLAKWPILAFTLPLSWLEMIIASFIASKLYSANDNSRFQNKPTQALS